MAEIDLIEIGRKAADGTLTIGEAMSVRTGDPAKTIRNRIKKLGYSLDDNWSTVSTDKFLRELQEVGSSANFVELGATEQILAKLAAQSEEGAEYKYKFGYGASGRANRLELSKNKQPRGTSEAGQSRVKPKAVPPAQDAIPAFVKGINAIPDPQTRAAVAFNFLVPLRPGEVGKIGIDDFDFETGQFKEEWRRGNKIRGAIQLPEVALEILRDAHAEAVANGQSVIFDRTTAQMTAATKVPNGIRDQFKPYEKILGGGKERPFVGASDIRKIVPSLMVGELNMGISVSTIMGHATYDQMMGSVKKMTAANYISPIDTGAGSAERQALSGLHNMMAEVMGLETLNELPASLNVSANNLTTVGSPKLQVIPRGSDIVPTAANQNVGPLTEVDVELIEEIRETRRAELRASRAAFDLQATTAEIAAIEAKGNLTQAQIDAAVEKSEALSAGKKQAKEDAKVKKGSNYLSKFLGKTTDVSGKVIKGLFPVAVGASIIEAEAAATEQGASPFSAAMQGLAAGASEVVAPPGMAYSDASFREEQRATMPTGSGLGPRTDVAPQMDALGYIKPEFASYPMEAAPQPNIPNPVAPKPQMAAQGFVPVPEARANAMRKEETTMKESEVPSFLYGGIVR